MDEAARVLADPQAYADETRLHGALTHLRTHAPVSWVDVEGYKPFWARIKSIELAGAPELMATTFVGGLKHLPIRYSLK